MKKKKIETWYNSKQSVRQKTSIRGVSEGSHLDILISAVRRGFSTSERADRPLVAVLSRRSAGLTPSSLGHRVAGSCGGLGVKRSRAVGVSVCMLMCASGAVCFDVCLFLTVCLSERGGVVEG